MSEKLVQGNYMLTLETENGAKLKKPFDVWTNTAHLSPNYFLTFHGIRQRHLDHLKKDELMQIAKLVEDWWTQEAHT